MTGRRKLREVNGATRPVVPGAAANGIGAHRQNEPATAYAKAACYPKRKKLAAGYQVPMNRRTRRASGADAPHIEQ
jgi:hypothetical protein